MAADDVTLLPVGKAPGDLLARLIARHRIDDPAVLVGPGIGRDAAAIEIGGQVLVAKTDPITFAADSAPYYLVNVNANDLACLGAEPRWMLVTALLPEGKTTEALVERLFLELQDACVERGIALVGGHTEITAGIGTPILVGQLLGLAEPGRLLEPGGGKPGDRLLLTKALAIEGTALVARERGAQFRERLGAGWVETASALLTSPGISIVPEARALLAAGGVTALHDPTEGGLATGLHEIAKVSGCGVVVREDAIPLLAETRALASEVSIDPLGMLASGSLLAAISPGSMAGAESALREIDVPFAWIGKLTPASAGFTLVRDDRRLDLPVFARDEVARILETL